MNVRRAGYTDMTVRQVYDSMAATALDAKAWVEAENIMAVRAVICRWFELMESGEAAYRYPDPMVGVDHDRADRLVEELDADFDKERMRFPGGYPEAGPAFHRLPPHARLAFAQGVFAVMKTQAQLDEETCRRLEAGEQLPPEAVV